MTEKTGFDFCFWAKLMVAIPLIPIVAVSATSLFEGRVEQALAFVLSIIAVVLIARKIDQIPALSKKIGAKDS